MEPPCYQLFLLRLLGAKRRKREIVGYGKGLGQSQKREDDSMIHLATLGDIDQTVSDNGLNQQFQRMFLAHTSNASSQSDAAPARSIMRF